VAACADLGGCDHIVLGILTATVVGYFSPMRALLIAAGLAATYAMINGFVLFDYGNRMSAPPGH